jgi:uroporphyrinogen decarboxylase
MPDQQNSLLMRALRNERTERPPVWLMRQAGRYLPEYMELRGKYGFLERCYTPEIATEITLQPLRRFPLDAGIIFSDILLPLHKMGADLHFRPGKGPQIDNPIRSPKDLERLKPLDPEVDLKPVLEAITLCTEKADVPILGFAGAPFTLACYLIEGSGSKDWAHVKRFMYAHPNEFMQLLNLLADAVSAHLQAQVKAGAAAVQLFDTWAGILSDEDFCCFALSSARRALLGVTGAPTLYFTRDSGPFLRHLPYVSSDAIALDWRIDIGYARSVLGDIPVQGNLDPIALQAPIKTIKTRVNRIIESAGPKGHIFNLGHGCTPETPVAGVQAVVEAVHNWRW